MWHRLSQIARSAWRVRPLHLTVAFGLAAVLAVASLIVLPTQRARADIDYGAETQITTDSANQSDPAISGNYIVYTDSRNSNRDIYLYDLTTKSETDLTPGTSTDQYLNDVNGTNVVYTNVTAEGGYEIYLFDIATSTTTPLATGGHDYGPAIDGNHVVWVDVKGPTSSPPAPRTQSIVLADIAAGTTTTLTSDGVIAGYPRVDGNKVVWQEYVGEHQQIFAYNITSKVAQQLTDGACDHREPDVSGNLVVWADTCYADRDIYGIYEIYEYDLATNMGQYLTTDIYAPHYHQKAYPRISGEIVVWVDNDPWDISLIWQIWGMYVPEGIAYHLASSSHHQILPAIDGYRIVWSEDLSGVGSNYDIFMLQVHPPIPRCSVGTTPGPAYVPPDYHWGYYDSDVTATVRGYSISPFEVDLLYHPSMIIWGHTASITYSADGAQTIPETTVPGDTATLPPITVEGGTSIDCTALADYGKEGTGGLYFVLDKTPPTISIASPQDGATYVYQQQVIASFDVTDANLMSYNATVYKGQPIDTSSLGTHSFTVTATDWALHTTTKTVSYTVTPGTTPPSTTATLSPAPNSAGWNTTDVSVSLEATDHSGSGVASITYSATGAQAIDSTTVEGASATAPVTTEGTTTITYAATDNAGHEESPQTVTVKIDKTAPITIATRDPAANSDGWNKGDVSVTLTATDKDGGSGVASITYSATGAQTIDSTTVPGASASVSLTTEGTTTLTYAATDNAGNTEDPKTVTVKIDKTQPTIAITAPVASSATDPAAYSLGQVVAANYTCTDPAPGQPASGASGASGIATCAGPVASGQPIDTSTGGLHTFTVNATDTAGNTASASVTYFVRYGWGPSGGVLQPINADGSSIFQLGSVVPVKFQLSGIDPNAPPVATLYLQPVSGDVTGSVVEAVSPGQADSGNQFRYDPTAQQYIFNLGTKGLEPGTYTLLIYVGGDKDSGMLLGSVTISLQ